MLVWLSVWSEVQTCIWPMYVSHVSCMAMYGICIFWDATATQTVSVKSRLVLPFWYRLTRVVPEKWPLNRHVCVPNKPIAYIFINNSLKNRPNRVSFCTQNSEKNQVFEWQKTGHITPVSVGRQLLTNLLLNTYLLAPGLALFNSNAQVMLWWLMKFCMAQRFCNAAVWIAELARVNKKLEITIRYEMLF